MKKTEATKYDDLHNFNENYSKNNLKERFVRDYIEMIGYIEPVYLGFNEWHGLMPKRAQFGIPIVVTIQEDWNTLFLFPVSGNIHILNMDEELIIRARLSDLDMILKGGE